MRLRGRQYVILARSLVRSTGCQTTILGSLSRSFVPPFFRQLILPTNAKATVASYLAFFVLVLGKFSIRMLQNEEIQNDGRPCCTQFMPLSLKSYLYILPSVLFLGLKAWTENGVKVSSRTDIAF